MKRSHPAPDAVDMLAVTLVYDSQQAGTAGMQCYEAILRDFHRSLAFELTLFSIDALNNWDERTLGLQNASDADVLLIALEAKGGLRPALSHWFSEVAVQRRKPGGLVLLFVPEISPQLIPLQQQIQTFANLAGMDFLCSNAASHNQPPVDPVTHDFSDPPLKFEEHWVDHWGIND
jgi:hypothetical protein